MKRWAWIWFCLFACLNVHAQSAWKKFPEKAIVECKKLCNTFTSFLYNDELQIEQTSVINNRMLQLQLRCPSHSLEYRSEVKVEKRNSKNGRFYEFSIVKSEEPLFFLPNEMIQIGFDLSSFNQNGEYIFTFQLHTKLGETYFVNVSLNTEKFKKQTGIELISYYPDYEKLRDDENHVYTWIEHYTEFPGGNEGLVHFLKENIKEEYLSAVKFYQSVGVGVIIEKDGSMLYPEVVNSNNRKLDAEAIRLVNMMPRWSPGSIDGIKVRNRVLVRIQFDDLEKSCFLFESSYY